MNITFLIGNGFDRNLGLSTTYSEFVKFYKATKARTETLKGFREHITENEELWSNAEVALGQYTSMLDNGAGAAFSACHTDICEKLAEYLKREETRIDYDAYAENVKKAFTMLNKIIDTFPTTERGVLEQVYKSKQNEEIRFNFICFNYTRTLDKCMEIIMTSNPVLGTHRYSNSTMNHKVGALCHVHGTVEQEMVFGVNDDSQIAKNDVFDCEFGDLYKNMLIKQQTNASYQENTDARAAEILNNSHIIYIYGMSIGSTDNLWWDRVCAWLSASSNRHVILSQYSAPARGVVQIEYQVFERKQRQNFTGHSTLDQKKRESIENRIHITNDNIFSEIRNIAGPQPPENDPARFDIIEEVPA